MSKEYRYIDTALIHAGEPDQPVDPEPFVHGGGNATGRHGGRENQDLHCSPDGLVHHASSAGGLGFRWGGFLEAEPPAEGFFLLRACSGAPVLFCSEALVLFCSEEPDFFGPGSFRFFRLG